MKLPRIFAAIIAMAATAIGATAQDAMFAVGPFNGWDAKAPLSFDKEGDLYSITLDFSSDRDFKMSTTSGAGAQGNGWEEFDSGALKPVGTAGTGEWIAIEHNSAGNIAAPENRMLTVQVDLAGMRMRFVRDTSPEYSGTLPVLFIATEGGAPVTSKEDYLNGTYYLDPMGAEGIEAIGNAEAPLTLEIRGRGNYTWTGFDKKPYRLKFTDKAAILGMDKSRHFALLAHADDRVGFMRNTLGFAASRHLGLPWTPAQKPVEVVLNGDYIGLYFLTETIRVDKNRVNITEQDDLATSDVDGGWLVEIDNYDSDPHVTVHEGDYPVWFTYKSPEVLSAQQAKFLQGQMQSIQNAIAAKDYTAFSALVDVDMLARYYIVQEVLNDYESFHGSCYLTRQRGDSERWKFGPVWDFGSALFNDNSNRFIWDSPEFHQVWIGSVYASFPQFVETVKDTWARFLGDNGPAAILADGEATADEIAQAAKCDYRRWPEYGNYDEQADAAKAFRRMESKIDWLKAQWGESGGLTEAMNGGNFRVYACNGTLHIVSAAPRCVKITSIDGRSVSVRLAAGVNSISSLPRGFYIVEGHKVAL